MPAWLKPPIRKQKAIRYILLVRAAWVSPGFITSDKGRGMGVLLLLVSVTFCINRFVALFNRKPPRVISTSGVTFLATEPGSQSEGIGPILTIPRPFMATYN